MNQSKTPRTGWSLTAAVTAAIAASICCLGPLLFVALGVGGAWASKLTMFEPLRPVFITLTVAFLAFGFYRAYRRPAAAEACGVDGSCAVPGSRRLNRVALWVATPLLLGLLVSPYLAPHLFFARSITPVNSATEKRVVLQLQNMDCPACLVTVRKSLARLQGVNDVQVTTEPPQAVVSFDAARISPAQLIEATTNAGYPSSIKEEPMSLDCCPTKGGAAAVPTKSQTCASDGNACAVSSTTARNGDGKLLNVVPNLTAMFVAELQYDDHVELTIPMEGRAGELIGKGKGTLKGDRINGTITWAFYAEQCSFLLVKQGKTPPADQHLCRTSPGGVIHSEDGAEIRFDARGYGFRGSDPSRPHIWHLTSALQFQTDDPRYQWLNSVLGVWEGEFDETARKATYRAYVQNTGNAVQPASQMPANDVVFKVGQLQCPLVNGVGCGHLLAPRMDQLNRIDGVEGSFSNWTGTLIRVTVLPNTDREAVAERVQKFLAADGQNPVRVSGQELATSLKGHEWRDVNRVSELSSFEFLTVARRRINAFADSEKLDSPQRENLLSVVDGLWDKSSVGLGVPKPEATAYAAYWQSRREKFVAAYIEQVRGALTPKQIEKLVREYGPHAQ